MSINFEAKETADLLKKDVDEMMERRIRTFGAQGQRVQDILKRARSAIKTEKKRPTPKQVKLALAGANVKPRARNFGDVVQAIYNQVPDSEPGFRKELRDLLESFPYNAPELSEIGGVLWTRLSYLVHDYVNKTQTKTFETCEPWEQQVLLILSGRK